MIWITWWLFFSWISLLLIQWDYQILDPVNPPFSCALVSFMFSKPKPAVVWKAKAAVPFVLGNLWPAIQVFTLAKSHARFKYRIISCEISHKSDRNLFPQNRRTSRLEGSTIFSWVKSPFLLVESPFLLVRLYFLKQQKPPAVGRLGGFPGFLLRWRQSLHGLSKSSGDWDEGYQWIHGVSESYRKLKKVREKI